MVLNQDRSNSTVSNHRRSVGVFPNRRAAEQALHALRDSGFPMDHVSVITRDTDRHDNIAGADIHDAAHTERVGNKADEGAATGAATGGVLGGLTGLLVGLGTLAIPGIGPVMLAGATATAIATTLAGGAIGAVTGGLLGGLIGLGIPEDRARVYDERVRRGEYLVIVDGNEAEISQAERILHHHRIEEYGVYDAPVGNAAATQTTPDMTHGRHYDRQAVGIFSKRQDAEAAIADLRQAGFPLQQLSLITRHFDHREPFNGVDLQDRFDSARYGIPSDRTDLYNRHFNRGDYLLIVRGTEPEVDRAEQILNRRGIQDWHLFNPAASHSTVTGSTPTAIHNNVGTAATYPAATSSATRMSDRSSNRFKRAIGVFAHRRDTEAALTQIRDAGFDMNQVSLISKDAGRNERIAGTNTNANTGVDVDRRNGNKADEGAKAGAATGAAVGGLGGLLVGLGALAIPGIGPVIAGGAAATALATALGGGAIGAAAGGLAGGLVGLGIPENRAKVYNDRLNHGDDLVIVEGTEDEIRRIEPTFKRHNIHEWEMYDADDISSARHGSGINASNANFDRDTNLNTPIGQTGPEVIVVDQRHHNSGDR